jgi:lipopolysaccharide/colanic/teichoic acid biosynthesis glycosyltransferase
VADGVLNGAGDMTPIVMVDIGEPILRDGRRHHAIPTVEGGIEAVPGILAEHAIACLLVVGPLPNPQLEVLRNAARRAGVVFRVAVPVPAMPAGILTAVSSGAAAVIQVSRPITRLEAAVKRTMDVIVATLLLVVASPFLLAISAAIKLTSPGPITFRQWRVTQGGRRFKILKFRTMDASRGSSVASSTAQPFFKMEDDPRLTPIGRIIRRVSLDELPQLWNVIRGDMSLVGPRPLPAEQVEAHPELLGPRNEVRAGLTGWWQVNGRSDLHAEEAVGYDLFYIQNWSLSFDLRILARTLPAIFSRRGAY